MKKLFRTDWQMSNESSMPPSRASASRNRTARRMAGSYRRTSSAAASWSHARTRRMSSSNVVASGMGQLPREIGGSNRTILYPINHSL
jgi:hypothetical protein